jgi:hypothetical protein
VEQLRAACAEVARRARYVRVDEAAIPLYAVSLPLGGDALADPLADEDQLTGIPREQLAAFWLTLDAINFGSGWFPTLRKPPGHTGYFTISRGLRAWFDGAGPWSAEELADLRAETLALIVGQDPDHELMGLFAASLNDLGRHVASEHEGRFADVTDAADGSAVALATRLGTWDSFADSSTYEELTVPFLKRAQITAADLTRAGVSEFRDLDRLTMFADNLVPHVLRLDGVLSFDPQLVERIDQGELIEHGSPEEVEIRACALHAVELIVASVPDSCAAEVDQTLWRRGQDRRYKSHPRHRSRTTAY